MIQQRLLFTAISVLILSASGCSKDHEVTAPKTPLSTADLSGVSYNVVAKNRDESVILLGQLQFGDAQAGALTGTWTLREWSGAIVPGLPGTGSLAGNLAGSTAVIQLDLPGTESSLGLVADGFVDDRLTGRISLLPSLEFDGTFEAIRSTP